MQRKPNRRRFLSTTGKAAAGLLLPPSARTAFGYRANERLNLAVVGMAGYDGYHGFAAGIHSFDDVGYTVSCDVDQRKIQRVYDLWKQRAAEWPQSDKPHERQATADHFAPLAAKHPPLSDWPLSRPRTCAAIVNRAETEAKQFLQHVRCHQHAAGDDRCRCWKRAESTPSFAEKFCPTPRMPCSTRVRSASATRSTSTAISTKPQPFRSPDEIRKDILELEKEAEGLLVEIIGEGKIS